MNKRLNNVNMILKVVSISESSGVKLLDLN